ncbi:MAG: hypothetical protein LBM70_09270 [Victivallales bacterium]|jgi:transcription elongation factor Elf1|nr:hypothetical protein [Victivallales bacterium]
MREGEGFNCPHCGEKSVVKAKNKLDGFTLVGKVLICALCGAEIEDSGEKSSTPAKSATIDRLAALLGQCDNSEVKADLTPDENYGRFCRNCVHFIEHPFKTLCGIDGKSADPMGECKEFKKRKI